MTFVGLEKKVCDYFKTALKSVRIEPYSGQFDGTSVNKISFRAPCIFVSFLGAQHITSLPDGKLQLKARWAAFILTKQDNETETALVEKVLASIHNQNLNLQALPATLQSVEQIATQKLSEGNLSCWLIRWEQPINLLTNQWLADAPDSKTNALVLDNPDIGQAHIDAYREVN